MPISTFPHGFTHGLTIRGLPIQMAYPGKLYWLNNSTVLAPGGIGGSDNNDGTYLRPFSTLNGAMAKLTAGRGDILMVMPGHAETISTATAVTLGVAGALVFGLGTGAARPTFTLGTVVGATVNVTAANVGLCNLIFKANFADVAAAITTTTAADLYIGACDFRDISAILNFVNIVKTATTSNATDGLYVENCNRIGDGATTNTCLVNMLGTNNRCDIRGNYVQHAAVTGGGLMQIASGKVVTNLQCMTNNCNLIGATGLTTGLLIIAGGTTNSGVLRSNFIKGLDATTPILVTASSGFIFRDNQYQHTADTSGYLLPAADS